MVHVMPNIKAGRRVSTSPSFFLGFVSKVCNRKCKMYCVSRFVSYLRNIGIVFEFTTKIIKVFILFKGISVSIAEISHKTKNNSS